LGLPIHIRFFIFSLITNFSGKSCSILAISKLYKKCSHIFQPIMQFLKVVFPSTSKCLNQYRFHNVQCRQKPRHTQPQDQERLGHGSIQINLDTYSHMAPGLQQAAANKFDDIVLPKLKNYGKTLTTR
jgi:hypothetical protein